MNLDSWIHRLLDLLIRQLVVYSTYRDVDILIYLLVDLSIRRYDMSDQNHSTNNGDNSDNRMNRGLEIAKTKEICELGNGGFSVPSATVQEVAYLVRLIDGKYICNCLDFKFKELRAIEACKHIHAVKYWVAQQVEIKLEPKPKIFGEDSIQCEKCGSIRVWKYGISEGKQIYKCKDCKTKFRFSLLRKAKYSPETISLCLDLYFSGDSLTKTARILNNQYGLNLAKVTVYRWIKRFIPIISEYVNKQKPELSGTWHMDEVFVKMHKGIEYRKNKNMAFLWNVMDRKTRFLLCSKVSAYRDEQGCTNAINEAVKNAHGVKPEELFTDAHRAYNTPVFDLLPETYHREKAGINKPHSNNNRVERLNGTIRERTKVQRAWKKFDSPIPEGQRIHYNFVKPHMALEGQTPAQRAGISIQNNWLELLKHSINRA